MALTPTQQAPLAGASPEDLSAFEDLYSPVQGNSSAESWRQADPLGTAIFGWGNQDWNNEIAKRVNNIGMLRGQLSQQELENAQGTANTNNQAWNELGTALFGPNGDKLDQQYANIEGSDQGALGSVLDALGSYQNAADLFNNPNFYGDVGDVNNAAIPTPQTLQQQQYALDKYKQLSSPTETAEEQLMRLTAQRQEEQQNQAGINALDQALKSRGVYGSGAEILGALGTMGTNAQTRSMANAQANASAQQRAMQALGSYSDLASQMRGEGDTEGQIANQVAEFNNQVNQNTANQRAAAQIAATQKGQGDLAQRAQMGFQDTTNVNNQQRGDIQNTNQTEMNYTGAETGGRTADTQNLNQAYNTEDQTLGGAQAALTAQKRSSLLGIS